MQSHNKKQDAKRIDRDKKRKSNKGKVLKIANFPISKKILEVAVENAFLNPRTGIYDRQIRSIVNCYMAVAPDILVFKKMIKILKKVYRKENPDFYYAIKKLIKRHRPE